MPNWLKINRSPSPPVAASFDATGGWAVNEKGLLVHPSVVTGFVPADSSGHTTDVRQSGARAMIASVLLYAAIRYRATKIAEAPMFVVDETAEGEPWVQNHPLARLLEQPNPDQEMADLLEETQQAWDLDGRVLWLIDRDRLGRPAMMRAYAADEFSVEPANGRLYGRFRVQTAAGPVVRGPEDVVFHRYLHPSDRFEGLSPTDVVLSRLGIETELVAATKAGLRNAIIPSIAISHPKDATFTTEQWREYKASIRDDYASTLNFARPLLAKNGATVTRMPMGFAGLEGGDLYREVEAAVCIGFNLRPEILAFMIGLENSPWSHLPEAHRLIYGDNIIPQWNRIARGTTRQLLRPLDPNPARHIRFDLSKIRHLQEDRERNARIGVLSRKVLTLNERRQLIGYEPKTGKEWDEPEKDERANAAGAIPAPAKVGGKAAASALTRLDAAARGAEAGWTKAATAQLEADRKTVLRIAGEVLRAGKDEGFTPADPATVRELAQRADEYFRSPPAAQAWRARVDPLIRAGARQGAKWAAADLGISFDLAIPGAVEYAERHAGWLVREVNSTTRTAIAEAVADSIEAKESVGDLTRRIQDAAAFDRGRAELIARTESTAVLNGAQWSSMAEYAESSGAKVTKTWLSAQDDRVRDEHAEMDGETRPLAEEFSNGLQHPGEPNCRCTLVYALED